MKKNVPHRNKKGFTLIELLVASTIIAVIMAIGMVSYTNTTRKSRDTKRVSDLEQLRTALEMYRADNGYYPNSGNDSYVDVGGQTSGFLKTALVDGGYMPSIPDDPKNASYSYYYQRTSLVSGQYYGYCMSANLEGGHTAADPCTNYGTYNYSVKSP